MIIRVFAAIMLVLSLSLPLSFLSEAKYYGFTSYGHPAYHYKNPQILHWGFSKFYKYPDGLILSKRYNRQTIRDLVRLCQHLKRKSFYLMPENYEGSIPPSLRPYALERFTQAKIKIRDYHPSFSSLYFYKPGPGILFGIKN